MEDLASRQSKLAFSFTCKPGDLVLDKVIQGDMLVWEVVQVVSTDDLACLTVRSKEGIECRTGRMSVRPLDSKVKPKKLLPKRGY